MKKYIIAILAISLTLTSCQNDVELCFDNEVRIDAIYPSSIASRVTNNNFDNDDQIGFYMVKHEVGETPILQYAGNFATNIKATFNGVSWVCSPKVFWENGQFDFYAYYPYLQEPSSIDMLDFQVQLDQTEKGYSQSDFLWAKSTSLTAAETAVPLAFAHKMSRINIVFTKGDDYTGDLPENADVYIHNTNPNAIIDLNSGDIICNSRLSTKTIKARYIANASYEAIVVPQRLSNRVPLIEVVVNNISYLVESKFIFKSGMNHIYKVILSDNPEKVEIEIGGSIQNWE